MIQTSNNLLKSQELSLTKLGLLIDQETEKESLFFLFKKTLSDEICEYKTLKKNAIHKKIEYSLVIYNKALNKIIDLISEKQYLLKSNLLDLPKQELEEEKIRELNLYFEKYFKKYKERPNRISWKDIFHNPTAYFLNSFNLSEPKILLQKKKLADKGYSMVKEIENFLDQTFLNENLTFEMLILNLTNDFLVWADKHPKSASFLISDIALTGSILLDKDAGERLFIAIDTMIVTRLFFDALGFSADHEDIEDEDLLKFRALADFVHHCPKIATGYKIMKKTINGEFQSLFSFLTHTVKETTLNLATQKIVHLVPQGKEKLVSLMIDTIRGRELKEILAHQRMLALIQLSGSIRKLINEKESFFNYFEISWKTIFEAKGSERNLRILTQIVLPLFCHVLILLIYLFKSISLSYSLLISTAIILLTHYATKHIDQTIGYLTKQKVLQKLKKQRHQDQLFEATYQLHKNPKIKNQISNQLTKYLVELEKRAVLFNLQQKIEHVNLNEQELQKLNRLKEKYLQKLKIGLIREHCESPTEIVTLFNDTLKLKQLREKLIESDGKTIDFIVYSIVHDLRKEWMEPSLEKIFQERAVKFSKYTEESFIRKEKLKNPTALISIDEYFKSSQNKINAPYQKKLYKKAIQHLENHNKLNSNLI